MNQIKYTFGTAGAVLGVFLGGWDGCAYALVTFVVIDYVTELLSEFKRKAVSSKIGFWGLVRKMLIFTMIGIANILDVHVLRTGQLMRTAMIFFFLSNEGLSVLENTAELGVPVSQKLKDVLVQLQEKEEKKEKNSGLQA